MGLFESVVYVPSYYTYLVHKMMEPSHVNACFYIIINYF